MLGILAVNVLSFAGPGSAAYSPDVPGPGSAADHWAFAFTFVFFEGKMRALFSILFGASLLLFIVSGFAWALLTRTPVKMNVMRDRASLAREVEVRERAGQLSGNEAVLIRIGLIQATIRYALDHEKLSDAARDLMQNALGEMGVFET